jgi:CheY-like chemotaxis protein
MWEREMSHIYWIEDDADIIWAVVQPLVDAKNEVHTLKTISSALKAVEELKKADLILLDMILPPGDLQVDPGKYPGMWLLKKLRNEYGVSVPVIVLSVVNGTKLEGLLEELSVASYLRKPVLQKELQGAIEKVLRQGTTTRATIV